MKWLKENWLKLFILCLLLLFAVTYFYWFQYRPTQIKADCNTKAIDEAKELYRVKLDLAREYYKLEQTKNRGLYNKDDYETYYKTCLREKGLDN